jgi:hypothetical protein
VGGSVGLAAVASLILLIVNAGQGIIPCGLWSNAIIYVPFHHVLGDYHTCAVSEQCCCMVVAIGGLVGLAAVACLIVLSVNAGQGIIPCGLWSNAIIYVPFHHVLGDYHTCAVSEQCCCMVVAIGGLVGLAAVASLIVLSVNAGQGIIPCGLWSNAIIYIPFHHVLGEYQCREQCCCIVVAMGGLVGLAVVACLILLGVNAGQGIIPCGLWSNPIIYITFSPCTV